MESLINGILALVNPPLYRSGLEAFCKLKMEEKSLAWRSPSWEKWVSLFSGIGVIADRRSPPHKDTGGWPDAYDLLASMGKHESAELKVHESGHRLSYNPGTLVAIAGRRLTHSCTTWQGSRLCLAHYFKQDVFERLGIELTSGVDYNMYRSQMSPSYVARQHL